MIPRPENPLIVASTCPTWTGGGAGRVPRRHRRHAEGRASSCSPRTGPTAVRRSRARAGVPRPQAARHPEHRRARRRATARAWASAMFNVHALGGEAMVAAAVRGATQGAEEAGRPAPIVLAVTVLSSLSGEALATPASLAFEASLGGCGRRRGLGRRRRRRARGRRRGVRARRAGHPSRGLERSRSGARAHAARRHRGRRRLHRRRAADHRSAATRPVSRARSCSDLADTAVRCGSARSTETAGSTH